MSYISADLSKDRSKVIIWERKNSKARHKKYYDAPYYFYVSDENGPYEDIFGNKLQKLEYPDSKTFYNAVQQNRANGMVMWESDISPIYKVLSHNYTKADKASLNITFFDIETDYDIERGYSDVTNPYAPINAISLYHKHEDRMVVYVVPPDTSIQDVPSEISELGEVYLCKNERDLLLKFLDEIENSDIISGWNSEAFDIPYVYERIKKCFGENIANRLSFQEANPPYYKEIVDRNGTRKNALVISGRIHLDLMLVVQKFEPKERDSFALENVAEEILKDMKKLSYKGSLAELYRKDFWFFVRYNLRDSEILKGLEQKKGYISLAVTMAQLDTCPITDVMGTIKLTEMAITNYCHHELKKIVPDCQKDYSGSDGKFGGAFVLSPQVGEHSWVATIDVNSLYPSTMRSINISPEVIIGQFRNRHDDFLKIKMESPLDVTLDFDNSNMQSMTKSGKDWKKILKRAKWAISGFGTVFDQNTQGIIPALLTQWFAQRKSFKKIAGDAEKKYLELKDTNPEAAKKYYDEYRLNDLLQQTFKLKLNSTYGACGNRFFRFYDVRLAESTTKTGVEVLLHMARLVGKELADVEEYPNPAVIYGDTDSILFKTFAENKKEAETIATYITNKINGSFSEFVRDSFCLNDGFDSLLAVSQEVIADRTIFIDGKKSYMLHLVKKDGNDVDDIKITGLPIKKTTIPKPVRLKLISSLENYLKNVPWDQVGLGLLEYKESLMNTDSFDIIGLPKKIKGLEEYAAKFAIDKSTRLPGHVRASIFWNQCLEKYGDKVSFKISSGMKIRIFYFQKKIGDFNSIAVPVDLEVIPDWFKENFAELIDKEKQIDRLIDKPLNSILSAIKKTIPSRKSMLIEELFE
jgi:DNA polymerase elongation subunit (family B)